MAERLTREQMAEKYPNQWLGINNIEYNDSSKKEIKSVNVVYTDPETGKTIWEIP